MVLPADSRTVNILLSASTNRSGVKGADTGQLGDLKPGHPLELLPVALGEEHAQWLPAHSDAEVVSSLGVRRWVHIGCSSGHAGGWPLAPTTEPVGLGGTSTYRPPHSADSRRGGGTGWDGARRYKPKTGKPRRTSGGSNGSKGGKPSMARSASSVQTENPSVRPLPNGLLVGP